MWHCLNCGEQHDDGFQTCWKCGSNPAGDRDPDFRVSEPVGEQDQAPDSASDETQLPIPRLPAVTYFSIPPYIWICLAMMLNDLEHLTSTQGPAFPPSPFEIVVGAIAAVLIGIPIFVTMARPMFFGIMRRRKPLNPFRDSLSEFFWMLAPFRLPESFRESHRWFVPIYYGSLVALLVVPLGAGGLVLWRLGS